MAKKSMIARDVKRTQLLNRYLKKRLDLKEGIRKADSIEDAIKLGEKLQKVKVDSSSVRKNARCLQCGRPRGVYRKFKLCRICLRNQLMKGNVPGAKKASW